MKKILIMYATYGMGHKKIAEYIEDYFKKEGSFEILCVDILKYSIPLVGTLSKKSFEKVNFSIPFLWDITYNAFNKKLKLLPYEKIILGLFKNKKLKNLILDFNPDIVISTHWMGSAIIGYHKKKGSLDSKLLTIITDYEAHELWLKNIKYEDAIIIGNKYEKEMLVKEKNIPKDKIKDFGIPLSNRFNSSYYNRAKTYDKYKLNKDKKTILYFCSRGNITKIYSGAIIKNNLNCNLIIVTGNNSDEKNRLTKIKKVMNNKNIKILGFVNNVPELLNIADIVVTKPGGATVTECLYFHKPMLFIGTQSGQEKANAKYLQKYGCAYRSKNENDMIEFLNLCLIDNKVLSKMTLKAKSLSKTNAMKKLYEFTNKLINK